MLWGNSFLGRGNSQGKGPRKEMGGCLASSRKSKGTQWPELSKWKDKRSVQRGKERRGGKPYRPLEGSWL